MEEIKQLISRLIANLYSVEIVPELSRAEAAHGDISTNIALQLAGRLGKNPRDIATELAEAIHAEKVSYLADVSVAGPGFINFAYSDQYLLQNLSSVLNIPQSLAGKKVVAEYSDPNPFKVLHAGHLYTSVVGDAIANLLEASGAEVHRVNYGGDVGLHVGKTMWAILQKLGGEKPENLSRESDDRPQWLAEAYILGNNAYDDDEAAKERITELNKRVYQIHAENDQESPLAQIYWTTRQWSYDYFDNFYARIGTKFEKYYPESQVAQLGLDTVKEQLRNGVFEQSDGAIVFKGEAHNLHTRVFINQQGLPTYEAKEIGLLLTKKQEFNFDISVVITGNEQEQYMAVVLKAVEQFRPELVHATRHLTHGLVKLKGGVKMSSRKGNILRAVEVLDVATSANKAATGKDDERVVLGAVKYAFLKVRTGGDIIYDPEESVSLEGNSGPYLQYAHARARSILAKAANAIGELTLIDASERGLVSKVLQYPDVVARAAAELTPHVICTYLYELAQEFNRFYEKNRVLGDEREAERLKLVACYVDVLKSGLSLLGIDAPETM